MVAIRAQELRELFQEKHNISEETLDKLLTKSPNKFTALENGKEPITANT